MRMFSNYIVAAVWRKAVRVSDDNDRMGFRKDACGAWIRWADYGNRNSQWGWEIDHILGVASGGSDSLSNLRPLQWENNVAKSRGRLACVVTGDGTTNQRCL
jgi:hypothetical protein